MAENKFAGKDRKGLFVGGQGPVHGQSISSERETKGLLDDLGSGKHLHTVGAPSGYSTKPAGREEAGFSPTDKGYKGPENWTPENKGVSNPFSVNER